MNPELTKLLVDAVLFKALGGLGIFLLGMKFMSEGMQAVAGDRLRKLIAAVTDNRIVACGVGTLITSLVQSSSVTTVMVIGFVNSGFMTLMQAIGVILGANIGTTITGWILWLKIGKWGLPILGASALVYLFTKNERWRYTAMCTVGIGMVFFGLETMASGFKHPEVREVLHTVFATVSGTTVLGVLKCALVGCFATMIVQSSSATLGVTIALAKASVIPFPTAAALILGLNIGTTITAFLASLGATTNARRAAYAHVLFNVIGTLWLLPVFFAYTRGVETVLLAMSGGHEPDITAKIAATHTGFNVINTIIFLPLMGILAKVVTRLVPEKAHADKPHLTYLDVRMLESPAIGIQQSQDEIIRMGEHVETMSDELRYVIENAVHADSDERIRDIFARERTLDGVQKEVTEFLTDILSGAVTHDVADAGRAQMRMADEYESISDYFVTILKLHLKRCRNELEFSKEAIGEILDLHDRVDDYVRTVNVAVKEGNTQVMDASAGRGKEITRAMKRARKNHLDRVSEGFCRSPLSSLVFTDILNSYRRVKDHTLNVAEALGGE